MTEFENLKNSYIKSIQFGLISCIDYHEVSRGNDLLHKLCEHFVDNSDYSETDKNTMKQELELLKETLSKQIESYYQK